LGPEYWLQRYNQDSAAGSPASLYVAEWNREVFELIRKGTTVDAGALWKRTSTAQRSPVWLTRLHYGPAQGFIPTSAYIWGLFIKADRTGSNQGSGTGPTPITTLEDLEKLLAARKAAGQTPIALGTSFGWPGAAWFTMLDLRMNGPEAVWERYEGKRSFNDEGALNVLRKLAEWRDKGWFSTNASKAGLADTILAVESGKAFCTLLGAYSIDRFTHPQTIQFVPFPTAGKSARAEIAGLTGLFLPADRGSLEASMALSDAYILGGSPGHVKDSYRVPVSALLKPGKNPPGDTGSTLTGIKATQAQVLGTATALVPAFDRAMPARAVQDSISLWSSFFAPGGPDPETFAKELQAVMGRSAQ
jgi:ABC-type glycerol-3-phosphate transport system substrate-binding protein